SPIIAHGPIEWMTGGSVLAALARGKFSFGGPQSPLIAEVASPNRATELVVQCRWLSPDENGQFARISLERQVAGGAWHREAETVVGPRREARELALMFHVATVGARFRLVFENAFA